MKKKRRKEFFNMRINMEICLVKLLWIMFLFGSIKNLFYKSSWDYVPFWIMVFIKNFLGLKAYSVKHKL